VCQSNLLDVIMICSTHLYATVHTHTHTHTHTMHELYVVSDHYRLCVLGWAMADFKGDACISCIEL